MTKAIIHKILFALTLLVLSSSAAWACCGFDGGGYDDPFGASSSSPGAFMGGGSPFGDGGSPFGGGSSGPGMWGGGNRSSNPFGAPGIVDYRDSVPRDPFGYSTSKSPSRDSYYRAPESKPVTIGDIFAGFTKEKKVTPGSGYSGSMPSSSIGAVLDGKSGSKSPPGIGEYGSVDRVMGSAPGTYYKPSTPGFSKPTETKSTMSPGYRAPRSDSIGAVMSGRSGVPGVGDYRDVETGPGSRLSGVDEYRQQLAKSRLGYSAGLDASPGAMLDNGAKDSYTVRSSDAKPSSPWPEGYTYKRDKVDMESARTLADSTLTASGEVRNRNYFWGELMERNPEMFSDANKYRHDVLGLSPVVDDTWIRYNPSHQSYKGDTLHHHHMDKGRYAVPLPETVHIGKGITTFWH